LDAEAAPRFARGAASVTAADTIRELSILAAELDAETTEQADAIARVIRIAIVEIKELA